MLAYYSVAADREFWTEHWGGQTPEQLLAVARTSPLTELIVAALPHPGNTADEFPDCIGAPVFADSLQNRVPDVRFVLDGMLAEAATAGSPFHRRIRTDAIAMTGLSFGGFTALAAVQQEPRFTVVVRKRIGA